MTTVRRPFPWPLLFHWTGRYLPVWFGLALIIFIVQTVLAAMLHDREDVRAFLQLLDRAPKIFKAFLGGNELMPGNITGIVAIGYQHPLVLIVLMINAAVPPTGLLTAEAERGTMEHLLARPITRSRVFWLAALIPMAGMIGLVGVIFGSTALWTRVFDFGQEVPLRPFFMVSVNMIVITWAVTGISVLAGVVFNERNRALGSVVAYLVVSYLLDFSAVWWPRIAAVHPWTLFYYCIPNKILRAGAPAPLDLIVLGSVTALSLALALRLWRRKDLCAA
jgi:ABC-type transport system involved in multi-copper enzyme maturation permease subunit